MSSQFSLSPSDFSSSDVAEEDLDEAASRGVRIMYRFPWGQEPVETLWSRGSTELLHAHQGARSKLQVCLLLYVLPFKGILCNRHFVPQWKVLFHDF